MAESGAIDSDLEGAVSPPRDNGEIVFDAPWEQRVFGLTLALCRSGVCDWESFRERLIARIGEDPQRRYWASWAAALEDLLDGSEILASAELDGRHRQLLARPAGPDPPEHRDHPHR
jgi:nitrile hydratase accessory protein